MVLTVPGRRPVSVHRQVRQRDPQNPQKWARDGRGNPVYADEATVIDGCSVQPGTSTESTSDGRDQVSQFVTIYAPLTWPGGAIDAVEIDGTRYQIVGTPQRWDHPRTGHVVVTVQASGG